MTENGSSEKKLETLNYRIFDHLLVIELNRIEAMNALNSNLFRDLEQVIDEAESDKEIRVGIITGNGKAFVAGADIAQMSKFSAIEAREFSLMGHRIFRKIENSRIPYIAAVNGFALGGGCELAMSCDFRIASQKAKFGQPEVNLGLIPGFGGTQRLPRLVGPGKAKELILTGEIIPADEALRIGLVENVVLPEELMSAAIKTAKTILEKGPVAIVLAKSCINSGLDSSLSTGCQLEAESFAIPFACGQAAEGIRAFFEKRKAQFS